MNKSTDFPTGQPTSQPSWQPTCEPSIDTYLRSGNYRQNITYIRETVVVGELTSPQFLGLIFGTYIFILLGMIIYFRRRRNNVMNLGETI
jgi:hypothetical protein